MAKKSMMARQKKKLAQATRRLAIREKLRSAIRNGSDEERSDALYRLHKSDRNDSMSRVRRRCNSCGRPHGVYRKFGLCRICLREVMMKHGFVPGLRKASW